MAKRRRPRFARLEDLPLQSCRRHCLDRPVRGADALFSAVVWIADPLARPSGATLVGGSRPSDGRVDCAAIQRGHRLARAPRYLVRDRDRVSGSESIRRIRAMGIRDGPISTRSPWQNGYAERLIGSIRRECLDHVVVFGERHLRNLRRSYQQYYNECRTHLSLDKDAPLARAVTAHGRVGGQPRSWWITSPILPCFSFRRDAGRFCQITATAAWVRPPPHMAPQAARQGRPFVAFNARRPRRSDAFEERAMFTL